MKLRILAALALFWPALALAQTSPNLTYGQVSTPGQWNSYFAAKQDVLGYTPVNRAGDTMFGTLKTLSPTGNVAGLVVTPGLAPTSPADGSIWVTNTGIYTQINGSTIGPLGSITPGAFAATPPLTVNVAGGVATFGIDTSYFAKTASNLSDLASASAARANLGLGSIATLNSVDLTANVSNTLPVANGGTGAASLTANGVLFGGGTGAVQATSALSAGQIVVGVTSGAPRALSMSGDCTLASSGAITCTKTNGTALGPFATASTINLTSNVTGTLPVANGGTGAATLGQYNVLLGNGTSALAGTLLTSGQLLVGQATFPQARTLSGDCTLANTGAITCTKLNGVSPGTTYPLNVGTSANNVVQLDGSSRYPAADGSQITNISAVWAPGTLNGLTLSRASATTVGIATGAARNEDTGTGFNMILASAITKSLSTWAAGTGNGGLDTGSIAASSWYHVWLIRKDSDGSIDALLSLSATAPTMPSGYTARRRIGAIKTDLSGQVIAFTQIGDRFIWAAASRDMSSAVASTSAQLVTLSVPTGISALADIEVLATAGVSVAIYVSSPYQNDEAPGTDESTTPGYTAYAASSFNRSPLRGQFMTNTSGQIRTRNSVANSTTIGIFTYGWVDTRGRS
jgi:hypothetical protein